MLALVAQAQKDVTKFLGIPVDGSKQEMIQKLKAKGYKYDATYDRLTGEFNGKKVNIYIITNNNKVYRIMVADDNQVDEVAIKTRFNILCTQFESNKNYIHGLDGYNLIPENENISYEMLVNKKRYEACYIQYSGVQNEEPFKKPVWFIIDEIYGKYRIIMYYDNEYNKANGEDL